MLPHSLQVVAKGAPVQENSLAGSFRQRAIVHNKKLNEIRHVLSLDLSPLLNHCADEFRPTFSVKSLRLNRPKIVTAHTTAVQDSLFFLGHVSVLAGSKCDHPGYGCDGQPESEFLQFRLRHKAHP